MNSYKPEPEKQHPHRFPFSSSLKTNSIPQCLQRTRSNSVPVTSVPRSTYPFSANNQKRICDGGGGGRLYKTLRLRCYRQEKIVQAFQKPNMGPDSPLVLRCTALLWWTIVPIVSTFKKG